MLDNKPISKQYNVQMSHIQNILHHHMAYIYQQYTIKNEYSIGKWRILPTQSYGDLMDINENRLGYVMDFSLGI